MQPSSPSSQRHQQQPAMSTMLVAPQPHIFSHNHQFPMVSPANSYSGFSAHNLPGVIIGSSVTSVSSVPTAGNATVAHSCPGIPSIPRSQPNEIFVGNLSFFCTERDLFDLFFPYGHVTNVRITRNDHKNRSLMFGFIAFASAQEAREMVKVFDRHLFMGRCLRVEPSEAILLPGERKLHRPDPAKNGFQVHLAVSSTFSSTQVVRPTETLLRRFFIKYGTICDVVIREYVSHSMPAKQEGYGFITFESPAVAAAVLSESVFYVDGIAVQCTRPHSPAASPTNAGMNSRTNAQVSVAQMALLGEDYGSLPLPRGGVPLSLSHSQYQQPMPLSLASSAQTSRGSSLSRYDCDGSRTPSPPLPLSRPNDSLSLRGLFGAQTHGQSDGLSLSRLSQQQDNIRWMN